MQETNKSHTLNKTRKPLEKWRWWPKSLLLQLYTFEQIHGQHWVLAPAFQPEKKPNVNVILCLHYTKHGANMLNVLQLCELIIDW